MTSSLYPYAPHYCEENVWQAAHHPDFRDGRAHTHALFISNALRQCPIWAQRASLQHGDPVVWDYHVVLLVALPDASPMIWDFDTLAGAPCSFDLWWNASFPYLSHLAPHYLPHFRLIAAQDYLDTLSSDRRHMRDASGEFIMQPPAWPPIFHGHHNLSELIDLTRELPGEVMDHHAVYARFHSP